MYQFIQLCDNFMYEDKQGIAMGANLDLFQTRNNIHDGKNLSAFSRNCLNLQFFLAEVKSVFLGF